MLKSFVILGKMRKYDTVVVFGFQKVCVSSKQSIRQSIRLPTKQSIRLPTVQYTVSVSIQVYLAC